MKTCQACPDIYPWTGKTGIRSSRIDNEVENWEKNHRKTKNSQKEEKKKQKRYIYIFFVSLLLIKDDPYDHD